MVRFSYVQTPDYPLSDSIDMIKTADDLGFYACYSVDEIYHRTCGCCSRPPPTRPATSAWAPTSPT